MAENPISKKALKSLIKQQLQKKNKKKKAFKGRLICVFKQLFSVFKQYFTYFNTFFTQTYFS